MKLIATNERPFDVSHLADGRTTYEMYASLVLKTVGVCEESGKTLVAPHWVGIARVFDEEKEVTQWKPGGAPIFEFDTLPLDVENSLLVRLGLPTIPFTVFGPDALSVTQKWWGDWKKIQKDSGDGFTVMAWDFGVALSPVSPLTSVTARCEDGREETIFFEWFIGHGRRFDVLHKARLEKTELEDCAARRAAADYIRERISGNQWRERLSGIPWILGVEACPQLPDDCLGLSLRMHFCVKTHGGFLAPRFGRELSRALTEASPAVPPMTMKLLTYAGQRTDYVQARDLREWPPVVDETPLRSAMKCDKNTLSRLEKIKSGLNELRNLDVKLSLQFAETHKYQLNPPLDERTLQNIENRHGVVLPEEYRAFLLHLGNGGAGPNHLETLQSAVEESGGILSEAFFASYQYLPIPDEEDCDEFDNIRRPDPNVNGALYLDLMGWGGGVMLIVTGEERGNLWHDLRGEGYFGLPYPLSRASDGARVGFLEWYENWLDDSINKLRSLAKVNEKRAGG